MKLSTLLLLLLLLGNRSIAQLSNTSYTNTAGEKVLRLELILPVTKNEAWKYFSSDSLLRKWIAPVAHIELKTGGYILTNYDKNKSLQDKSSITCGIISFLENELMVLKVHLNDNFSKDVAAQDQYLQEIIQFTDFGNGRTKITSSMIGWGKGKDWETTYKFFVAGNEWTYKELAKLF